jgi:hypothetical protein
MNTNLLDGCGHARHISVAHLHQGLTRLFNHLAPKNGNFRRVSEKGCKSIHCHLLTFFFRFSQARSSLPAFALHKNDIDLLGSWAALNAEAGWQLSPRTLMFILYGQCHVDTVAAINRRGGRPSRDLANRRVPAKTGSSPPPRQTRRCHRGRCQRRQLLGSTESGGREDFRRKFCSGESGGPRAMFSFIMFPSFFPSPHRRLHFSLGRYDLACPCIALTFTLLSSRGGNPTGFSTCANTGDDVDADSDDDTRFGPDGSAPSAATRLEHAKASYKKRKEE